ncbi:hypothetical protein ACIQUQ_28505 [Streptomyces sp. NPDC101118]|uniref:hypothetical protein n=1 Tax=Streptomyces sp. NPDC101118 TaxID=3366109 RepID=UPI0037F50A19
MTTRPDALPETDRAFLDKIQYAFEQHPEMAERYALASLALERELGIDYTRRHGRSRIEGERIITEFVARSDSPEPDSSTGGCLKRGWRHGELVCIEWATA